MTEAQDIERKMQIMLKGMLIAEKNNPEIYESISRAYANAAQMLANLKEAERLIQNKERPN